MKTRKGNKVYPLTAAQNLHFYCLKYCPAKQVLNIGSSLTIQVDLNWDVLRECIKEAIDRCEAMRLRFAEDKDGTVYQYVVRQDDSVIEQFDFTGWTQEEADAKMREWTETPFARYDSPMHRIVIIKMPDGFQGIYIAVDHMTMDAQSLILFFRDIIELYASRMYEEIDYPKPMSSYIKQLKKDLEYEAGSKASQKDRDSTDSGGGKISAGSRTQSHRKSKSPCCHQHFQQCGRKYHYFPSGNRSFCQNVPVLRGPAGFHDLSAVNGTPHLSSEGK